MSRFLTSGCRCVILAAILVAGEAIASPSTCEQIFVHSSPLALVHSPSTALIVNPQQRAVVFVDRNEQYLAHGKRGASTFVQMALYETNATMKGIARWILDENISPFSEGAEVEISNQVQTASRNIEAIQNLALEIREPKGLMARFQKSSVEARRSQLETAIKDFFENDMRPLDALGAKIEDAFDQIALEEHRVEEKLLVIQDEKVYVKSLIDRLNHLRETEHPIAKQIEIDVDLDLNEKLTSILEHETTFEQTLGKLKLRRSQLRIALTQMAQVESKLPITAAHIPAFMKAAKVYQAERDVIQLKNQAAQERRRKIEALRAKNQPRRERVQELRLEQSAQAREIAAYWSQQMSRQHVFIPAEGSIAEGQLTSVDLKMNRGVLGQESVRLDNVFLSDVPGGYFAHKSGEYVVDKKSGLVGRILGLNQSGDAVVESIFETRIILRKDLRIADSVRAEMAQRSENLKRALQPAWADASRLGDEIFVRLETGKLEKGRLISNQDQFVITTSAGTRKVTGAQIAYRTDLPKDAFKFAVGDAVTDGTRVGVVLGYFPSGQLIYKSTSSTRTDEHLLIENEAVLFAAKIPKPDFPIGSQLEVMQKVYENKLKTIYRILEYDPQTDSYYVEPEVEWIGHVDSSQIYRYSSKNHQAYTEGKKPLRWMKPANFTQNYGELTYHEVYGR